MQSDRVIGAPPNLHPSNLPTSYDFVVPKKVSKTGFLFLVRTVV